MAGTTTYYGISYPTNTDYVKDGATAMQTIADGFDSAVAIPTYNNQTGTSYTFVLADAGKTVTSNNASAVTFTIPPQASVAWANNTTLTVRNLGAGVVTIAGGAGVTVTNTAQTVAQYGSVRIMRTASNAWTVVPASGGESGLTLIASNTFTTQSTIDFTGCFSSKYLNYKLFLYITAASASDITVSFRMLSGSTPNTSAYSYAYTGLQYNGSSSSSWSTNATSGLLLYTSNVEPEHAACETTFFRPNVAQYHNFVHNSYQRSSTQIFSHVGAGSHAIQTAFDGLRILTNTGTISGVAKIYGVQN